MAALSLRSPSSTNMVLGSHPVKIKKSVSTCEREGINSGVKIL
jgi:hypothetical protein